MRLRIVSWNCNMGLHTKFEQLLSLRPDVAVIQECASPERDAARGWQPACAAREWVGFNPDKGLGIFAFGDLRLRRHASYSDAFSLYLPVEVSGPCRFNLLGVWSADKRKMPTGTVNDPAAAIRFYRPFLTAAPAVVGGDFNVLPQRMFLRGRPDGRSVVDLLAIAGLANAALAAGDRLPDASARRTHYHRRRVKQGFVEDYVFVPAAEAANLVAFDVADPHPWIQSSDHVPLAVEFDLREGSAFLAE